MCTQCTDSMKDTEACFLKNILFSSPAAPKSRANNHRMMICGKEGQQLLLMRTVCLRYPSRKITMSTMPSSLGTCTLVASLWQLPVCLFGTGVSDQEQHHCASTAFLFSICRILLAPENENLLKGKQFKISRRGYNTTYRQCRKKANRVTSSSGTTAGRNVWQQKGPFDFDH